MSQKRGLGRGLGALIPPAPAPAATTEERPSEGPAQAEAPRVESTTTSAETAPAKRSTARPEPDRSSNGETLTPSAGESPSRPSDMFFGSGSGSGSGSSAEDQDDRPRRDRPTRDIAGEMAAAARSRKSRGTPTPPRPTGAPSGAKAGATTGEEAEPAPDAAATDERSSDLAGAVVRGPRDWTPVRSDDGTDVAADHDEGEQVAEDGASPDGDTGPQDGTGADTDPDAGAAGAARESEAGPGGENLLPVPGAEFAEIPIDEIRVNPKNPRADFDEDELDELAASIREVGILQPIVVRPVRADDRGRSFEIVMGERRWRATQRSGLPRIPAIVRQTGDDDLLRDALIENLHRTQLNPLEEAAAYGQLLEDFDCTQDELAERIGRSRPQISNTLRLMRLPGLVQKRVASGALSAGHARALLPLEDVGLMEELAQRIVSEGLSVRQTEALVSRGQQPAARPAPQRSTYDPRVVDLTSQVSNRLQAPVRIDVGKRKGKMTVEFANLDDLERIIDELGL